jgi:hypothetical protein
MQLGQTKSTEQRLPNNALINNISKYTGSVEARKKFRSSKASKYSQPCTPITRISEGGITSNRKQSDEFPITGHQTGFLPKNILVKLSISYRYGFEIIRKNVETLLFHYHFPVVVSHLEYSIFGYHRDAATN